MKDATPTDAAFEALVQSRHSCRSFRPEPLEKSVIERILKLAQSAPSWCNTQPWRVTVVSGARLVSLTDALLVASRSGTQKPDIDPPASYLGIHRERRRESGYALYESLGIERSDRHARTVQAEENFGFFGAPHALIVDVDRSLGTYAVLDTGLFVNQLLLAAQALGCGSIAQAAPAMHSDVVRRILATAEDRAIACSVALGREDTAARANSFRMGRAGLIETVDWLDD